MRSRYAAYAIGGYGAYLQSTWWPERAAGLSVTSLSEKTTDWCGLQILDKSQSGDCAEVEFKAYFIEDGAPEGDESCLHERSRFLRKKGAWYYVDGDIF